MARKWKVVFFTKNGKVESTKVVDRKEVKKVVETGTPQGGWAYTAPAKKS